MVCIVSVWILEFIVVNNVSSKVMCIGLVKLSSIVQCNIQAAMNHNNYCKIK